MAKKQRATKSKPLTVKQYNRLMKALKRNKGNISAAARDVGMNKGTAWRYTTGESPRPIA